MWYPHRILCIMHFCAFPRVFPYSFYYNKSFYVQHENIFKQIYKSLHFNSGDWKTWPTKKQISLSIKSDKHKYEERKITYDDAKLTTVKLLTTLRPVFQFSLFQAQNPQLQTGATTSTTRTRTRTNPREHLFLLHLMSHLLHHLHHLQQHLRVVLLLLLLLHHHHHHHHQGLPQLWRPCILTLERLKEASLWSKGKGSRFVFWCYSS